jgi:hypothetical protein
VLTDFFSVLDATATTDMTGNPFARLVIPVLTGFFFGDLKQKKGFQKISFFTVFSGGIFHKNVILRGSQ